MPADMEGVARGRGVARPAARALRGGGALLSAGLYALAFPPAEAPLLAWVALVPLALALRGTGAGGAALVAGGWAALATVAVVPWVVPTVTGHFERSTAMGLSLLAVLALASAAPYVAASFAACARAAARRGPTGRALLFAAAFVAAELLRTQLGLRSPWARLGDSQFDAERLRQVADLAGVYGLSGLLAFANAALAEAAAALGARLRGNGLRAALAPTALAAVAAAGALAYGSPRSAAPPAGSFEIAVVQGNVAPELRWQRVTASLVLRRYGEMTRDVLRAADGDPPDLFVWPENAIQTPVDDPVYGPALRRLARGVPILLGAPRGELRAGERRRYNSAILVRPDGATESYDKRRLLPFSETRPVALLSLGGRGDLDVDSYAAGSEPGLFRVGEHTLGVLICMEALYPELAREAVREGATILLNPSNDSWYAGRGAGRQHLAQAVFRAVETRRPLLRATTTGVTALVDSRGELAASLPADAAGVLTVSLPPPAGGTTLYARTGDAFAWACAAACALACAAPAAGRRRTRGASVR